MADTLGMARAMLGHRLRSLSLDNVASFLGLGAKGKTVHKVQGMTLAAIKAQGLYDEYADYSCLDAELCYQIYRKLIAMGFPPHELVVMDTVLRCAIMPRFVLNQSLLAEHLLAVQQGKAELLQRAGLESRDELMSNDRFADALRALGVDPPMKTSLTTGKQTYAFAKTDADFIDLEEHPNPDVQALVSARLGLKSTIEETRTERFIKISRLQWADQQGLLPVPLRYSGAHTHRLSGDWKLNMQNLPSRVNNKLRTAIEAPHGNKVLAVDSSQIEARIAAWFCGVTEMVQQFANKEDVYSTFATSVFGYEVHKKTHPVERFVGKTGILGLQYGLGWNKFQGTVAMQSKAQLGQEVLLDDEQAAKVVGTYRRRYYAIPQMWNTLGSLLPRMTSSIRHTIGPVTFEKEAVILPSGLKLFYHNLRCDEGGQWRFEYGGATKYIYGGKMLENITQALARICVMDAAVRIRKWADREGIPVWLNLQVHDELVYVVPDELVELVDAKVMEEMNRRPSWAPDLPLDAESGTGGSFGDT
jgi:DNA polymerase